MTESGAKSVVDLQAGNHGLVLTLEEMRKALMQSPVSGITKSLTEWRYKHMLSHARAITAICEPEALIAEQQLGIERETTIVHEIADPSDVA